MNIREVLEKACYKDETLIQLVSDRLNLSDFSVPCSDDLRNQIIDCSAMELKRFLCGGES